jgi:hypothetical protein
LLRCIIFSGCESAVGVRRDKAALSSGCKSQERPARLLI